MLITLDWTAQQILDLFMESQFWPQNKMLDFQRENLTALLRHAKTNVPFYRSRLDCVLRENGTVDWDRWEDIPILTRADLRDHGEELTATCLPENDSLLGSVSSSGSTGTPITHHVSKFSNLVAEQGWKRFFKINNVSLDEDWVTFRTLISNGKPVDLDVTSQKQNQFSKPFNIIKKTISASRKVELLQNLNPSYVLDSTNHIEIVARENMRQGSPVKLKGVIAIGMAVTPQQQELFAESFGAWSQSPYSSKEGGLMAFSCRPVPSPYHVNQEVNFLEVVDENGAACPQGVEGRSIITPMFNYVQPLIRYDQGDTIIRGPGCTCGRPSMMLEEVSGRTDAIFRFPGKEFSLTAMNNTLVQNSLQADAYQFAQTEPMKLEVRYVSEQEALPSAQNIVANHLKDMIELDITITFQRVTEIPYNKGGKQQRVVREFD